MSGPLAGLKVLEMAGLGPRPFAAMMLADLGAEVVRVDRPVRVTRDDDYERNRRAADPRRYVMHRGRRSVAVDLKHPEGLATVLGLITGADVLIEGYRPGVMERLGLGPDDCLSRNPRLIYGRMTGWGQTGPLAPTAGHDIDYIALSGALNNFTREGGTPVPPLSLVGDFGGGGLLLAFGVMAAVYERSSSGSGQVIDAAMVEGAAVLTSMFYGLMAQGRWEDRPGTNFADTGAPYYEVYGTSDGRFVAFGALEQPFYEEFLRRTGLDAEHPPDRNDRANWPTLKERFAKLFAERTRDEWEATFAETDACVAPVLSFSEAHLHPHLAARESFVKASDVVQPAPAPRFGRTPARLDLPPPRPGEHTRQVLAEWGFDPDAIEALITSGAVA
jgi:alpha-methylacyl-CoA racemase